MKRPIQLVLIALAVLALGAGAWMWRARKAKPSIKPLSVVRLPAGFEPTAANNTAAPGSVPEGMVWIPGGEFSMGANDPPDMDEVGMKATEDARPIHRVYVDGFFMDKTDVTNAQFEAFVTATNYVTVAERTPKAEDFPGALPENLVAVAQRVGVRKPELIRVKRVDHIPLPGDTLLRRAAHRAGLLGPETLGLTLGYGIFIVSGHDTVRLLSHEFRHVYQYETLGSIDKFLPVYLQQIVDSDEFQKYPPVVLALLPKYGGVVLASDTSAVLVEGTARTMNAIIRFPSKEAALGLYNDPGYQEAKRIRQASTKNVSMVLVEEFKASAAP